MSDTKKMKFRITITDNETGETLYDTDAKAIIAAVNEGPKTASLGMFDCDPFGVADTLNGAETALQTIYTDHPELRAVAALFKVMGDQSEEPEETENN